VELSPAYLFGQSGDRSMWGKVQAEIREEDAAAAAIADEFDELSQSSSATVHAQQGIAAEASRLAGVMREQVSARRADKAAQEADAAAKAKNAMDAHDAKVREFVERIKAEKAAKAAGVHNSVQEVQSPAQEELGRGKEDFESKVAEYGRQIRADTPFAETIEDVLGYREFKGQEQWQVLWSTGDNSWETWGVLLPQLLKAAPEDAEKLRRRAEELKT
jgi:hypothetical protein